MPKQQIYLLSPREFSPETIAVAFAKTSRSPESFREIAQGLTDQASAQFHERWVIGYGHASVAEHAVLHLAIENVSRLAIEAIESNRLASYTEKSTRYQKWGPDDFILPPELEGHPLKNEFIETVRLLFATYTASLEPVRQVVAREFPPREGETEAAWDRRIRSRYVDVCRFLLPAAAIANVGMTVNARELEHAIRKLLSHALAEVRTIGEQIKEVALTETPTLIKYAEAVPYLDQTRAALQQAASTPDLVLPPAPPQGFCTLVDYDPEGENTVLAAALYRYGEMSFTAALDHVRRLSSDDRLHLAHTLLGHLGPHDIPLRELEYCSYTFDLIMDQGAYAEFKRHRMMTQTPQRLTTHLGYAIPRLIEEAGLRSRYEAALQAASQTYERLAAWNPDVAQYVVPNGFYRRVLARFNLRTAYHFCRLRSAPNAHFSIRKIAQRIAEEIRRVHPALSAFLRLPGETWQEIEKHYFSHPDSTI